MTGAGALRALARLYHVQTAYTDISGRRRVASVDSLLHVLRSLGAPLDGIADAPDALRAREASLADEVVAPVTVIRSDARPVVLLRAAGSRKVEME
ncbi:MAG: hypothetical protein ACRDFT_00655, partial [bacterium]